MDIASHKEKNIRKGRFCACLKSPAEFPNNQINAQNEVDCGIVTMDQGAKLDFTSLRLATISYYPSLVEFEALQ